MEFTEEELQLLDRHYAKIKIFGRTFLFWDTSPKAVLQHLQEMKEKKVVEPDIRSIKKHVYGQNCKSCFKPAYNDRGNGYCYLCDPDIFD